MELAKAYEPASVEERWYREWMARDLFTAHPGEGTPYCITIPPPNITGSLHMGHALNNSILDTLTRWRRMCGDNALCLPGTDHAGIATQNVVEREIAREGLTRHALGREGFIERCRAWREQYGNRIYHQLQRLGCSYDWSRARYTMDESYVEAIHEEFLRWWDRGLIYRGARVVNWCPRCRSAISDIEVESEPRSGWLYHIRYPLANGEGALVVATTRPETMLGDTAVAVNPEDERYTHLVGAHVRLPLTDRTIPVIADDYAKREFGSGAVKVTPAHDLDDFECGLRHGLPQVVVIAEDGSMSEAAGPRYSGMDRFAARERIVADLTEQGLLEKTEPYTVNTPLCDRCKTVLEPLLSEQWFVHQEELAGRAIEAIEQNRVLFFPERYRSVCLEWLRKIRPWCISRQLWWGHRIPVWWTEDRRYAAGRSAEEAARKLGVPPESLKQDEDVLDTWFSSALWPHATLGWPRDDHPDLQFWYPTNLLSTAQEILYLWVARMIMTGLDFLDQVPFHHVYVHATVLDARGERMSKSKGNGIDPLDLIAQFGADATRFALLQQAGKNQDIRFSEERVKLAGQFCNKLWNASRFVLLNLQEEPSTPVEQPQPHLADRWIASRLARTVAAVESGFAGYDMDDAMRAIYAFLWDEFCDWYVEMAKVRLRGEEAAKNAARRTLVETLETTLRLVHPAIPFITEEIWQALRGAPWARASGVLPEHCLGEERTILRAPFPRAADCLMDTESEEAMGHFMECVRALRNLRAELGIDPGKRLRAAVFAERTSLRSAIVHLREEACALARLESLDTVETAPTAEGTWASSPVAGGEVYLEIGAALDVARELERLAREITATEANIARSRAKLADTRFTERAPAAIVEKERAQLAAHEETLARLAARRALFTQGKA